MPAVLKVAHLKMGASLIVGKTPNVNFVHLLRCEKCLSVKSTRLGRRIGWLWWKSSHSSLVHRILTDQRPRVDIVQWLLRACTGDSWDLPISSSASAVGFASPASPAAASRRSSCPETGTDGPKLHSAEKLRPLPCTNTSYTSKCRWKLIFYTLNLSVPLLGPRS